MFRLAALICRLAEKAFPFLPFMPSTDTFLPAAKSFFCLSLSVAPLMLSGILMAFVRNGISSLVF